MFKIRGNGTSSIIDLYVLKLATGHAQDKHGREVVAQYRGICIDAVLRNSLEEDLREVVIKIIFQGEMRMLSNSRMAFWENGIIVIVHPDMSTITSGQWSQRFVPYSIPEGTVFVKGKEYFDRLE